MQHIQQQAQSLKAIGNPAHLEILRLLTEQGEMTGTAINRALSAPQSNISQILLKMKREGVLTARPDGNYVYYAVAQHLSLEFDTAGNLSLILSPLTA